MVPYNNIEMRIAFKKDWIQKMGNPGNMSLIKVSGDSMEPTLMSGDLVLIDHNRNYISGQDGIYAITMNGAIMIKRIQIVDPSKILRIISDNDRYDPLDLPVDQVKINGKVIWFERDLER